MPEFDTALLVLAPIAFAGAIVFGVTGFGSALVTIPLALHFFPMPFVLALFALVDFANALRVGLENPRNAARGELKWIVPFMLVGTVLGVTLLVNLPRRAGMAALGAFIVSYALYSLLHSPTPKKISGRWAPVAGLAGGLTSTLFGAGGPPYAIYLAHRALDKARYRATMGLMTMASIGTRVIAFLVTGLLLDARVWLAALVAVPAALAGITVARHIFVSISRETLLRLIAVVLLVSGAALVWRALG